MYVQLQKALYGTLSAALLFWKDLSGHLHNEGFEPNPYDSCVMNKMVDGKQCTVLWHVKFEQSSFTPSVGSHVEIYHILV
jgi:hypothetical protein